MADIEQDDMKARSIVTRGLGVVLWALGFLVLRGTVASPLEAIVVATALPAAFLLYVFVVPRVVAAARRKRPPEDAGR